MDPLAGCVVVRRVQVSQDEVTEERDVAWVEGGVLESAAGRELEGWARGVRGLQGWSPRKVYASARGFVKPSSLSLMKLICVVRDSKWSFSMEGVVEPGSTVGVVMGWAGWALFQLRELVRL